MKKTVITAEGRTCCVCDEFKPWPEFHKGATQCRQCKARWMKTYREINKDKLLVKRAAWGRDRYAERKARYLAMLGDVCVECGTTENLHFHHIDPTTKAGTVTGMLVAGSEWAIEAEVRKCELRCSEHHRPLHLMAMAVAA